MTATAQAISDTAQASLAPPQGDTHPASDAVTANVASR